ncbi:MAG TPA: nucleotidyl transferase AbiEii/AbiGii toxin family protein [Chlamydiales bacterium]|nr:nucleotidyl transferase AbiEii/AbiGii toxin family protein [Chlamydiales bacterium]
MNLDLNIKQILSKYQPSRIPEIYKLREILQQAALLGLSRQNFFQHAAFYGGTALRILFGLDRFSEDLDFSLLAPDPDFDFQPFLDGLSREMEAMGFRVEVTLKEKSKISAVQSAFLKTNTLQLLLTIEERTSGIHPDQKIKVKVEVDTDPPKGFRLQTKTVINPVSFHVVTLHPSDLFAGKLHAALYRAWQNRIKGRDWYDLIWFIRQKIPLSLPHFQRLMIQAGHWKEGEKLSVDQLHQLIRKRIQEIDWAKAVDDVKPFVDDLRQFDLWSADFFYDITQRLHVE